MCGFQFMDDRCLLAWQRFKKTPSKTSYDDKRSLWNLVLNWNSGTEASLHLNPECRRHRPPGRPWTQKRLEVKRLKLRSSGQRLVHFQGSHCQSNGSPAWSETSLSWTSECTKWAWEGLAPSWLSTPWLPSSWKTTQCLPQLCSRRPRGEWLTSWTAWCHLSPGSGGRQSSHRAFSASFHSLPGPKSARSHWARLCRWNCWAWVPLLLLGFLGLLSKLSKSHSRSSKWQGPRLSMLWNLCWPKTFGHWREDGRRLTRLCPAVRRTRWSRRKWSWSCQWFWKHPGPGCQCGPSLVKGHWVLQLGFSCRLGLDRLPFGHFHPALCASFGKLPAKTWTQHRKLDDPAIPGRFAQANPAARSSRPEDKRGMTVWEEVFKQSTIIIDKYNVNRRCLLDGEKQQTDEKKNGWGEVANWWKKKVSKLTVKKQVSKLTAQKQVASWEYNNPNSKEKIEPRRQQVQPWVWRRFLLEILTHVCLNLLASWRWLPILIGLCEALFEVSLDVEDLILRFTEADVVDVGPASLHLTKGFGEVPIPHKHVHHHDCWGFRSDTCQGRGQDGLACVGPNLPILCSSSQPISGVHRWWQGVVSHRLYFSHLFRGHLLDLWGPLVSSEITVEPGVLGQVQRRRKNKSAWVHHGAQVANIWLVAKHEVELPIQDVVPCSEFLQQALLFQKNFSFAVAESGGQNQGRASHLVVQSPRKHRNGVGEAGRRHQTWCAAIPVDQSQHVIGRNALLLANISFEVHALCNGCLRTTFVPNIEPNGLAQERLGTCFASLSALQHPQVTLVFLSSLHAGSLTGPSVKDLHVILQLFQDKLELIHLQGGFL